MRKFVFLCFCVLFSANLVGQVNYSLDHFNKIDVYGPFSIRFEKGTGDSIIVKSKSDVADKVKVSVRDSVLYISLLSEIFSGNKIALTVVFNEMKALKIAGGAKVYNKGVISTEKLYLQAKSGSELELNINADTVFAKVSKGAFIRLRGENKHLNIKTSTGGDFRSTLMNNVSTEAILNGGTVEISTAEVLNAKVRYGSILRYKKQPQKIKRKEFLGGKIEKLEDF